MRTIDRMPPLGRTRALLLLLGFTLGALAGVSAFLAFDELHRTHPLWLRSGN